MSPKGYFRRKAVSDRMGRSIPPEVAFASLHSVAAELGRPPKAREQSDLGSVSYGWFKTRFDSWDDALEIAGVGARHSKEYTDEELLETLTRLAEKKGRPPTADELNAETDRSNNTYQARFGSWNGALRAAGLEPSIIRERQECECLSCGATLFRQHSQVKNHDEHFCDDTCMGEYESDVYSGDGNPRWIGGYTDYYGEEWPEQRAAAMQRDGEQCQGCGTDRETHRREVGSDLHVHHIQKFATFDDSAEANRLDNLVTLCRECHQRWERHSPLRPVAE